MVIFKDCAVLEASLSSVLAVCLVFALPVYRGVVLGCLSLMLGQDVFGMVCLNLGFVLLSMSLGVILSSHGVILSSHGVILSLWHLGLIGLSFVLNVSMVVMLSGGVFCNSTSSALVSKEKA